MTPLSLQALQFTETETSKDGSLLYLSSLVLQVHKQRGAMILCKVKGRGYAALEAKTNQDFTSDKGVEGFSRYTALTAVMAGHGQ